MSIDVSEGGQGYYDLRKHIGHKIVIVGYGNPEEAPENIALECEDCNEVLVDFNEPFYDEDDVFAFASPYSATEVIPRVRAEFEMVPVLTQLDCPVKTAALKIRIKNDLRVAP